MSLEPNSENNLQDIIGLIVHSYNNYLAGVMGFTELALLESEENAVKERLEKALNSGNDAIVFSRELLSSIGRLQLDVELVDVAELMNELSRSMSGVSVKLQGVKDCTQLMIKLNNNWFQSCLRSVIEFCKEYSGNEVVEVKLYESNEYIVIQILSDFGLSKEQSEQLFSPFYSSRVLLARKDIGLSVVKGFVDQINGDISCEPNKGFKISIPKAKVTE